ncbi:uncharacterized protein LOC127095332 [Lathyrus oleraceus]|uniref:uncharacterized protein LOC127095332 n=1 Tax=Pisum sativum TaxID=3888 RepID=UPI0021CE077D|nr:uncharacterized protein LOC127095332 [Pisum sativum]
MRFKFPDEDIMNLNNEKVIGDDESPEPGARWKLMFNGALNSLGHGIRVILILSRDDYTPFTTGLCFDYTNNLAEYEPCIMGIEVTIDLKIKIVDVYGDSTLVIYQGKGDWGTCHPKLTPYRAHVVELMKYVEEITFHHILREENQVTEDMATLASMYQVRFHNEALIIIIDRKDEPTYYQPVEEEADGKSWFHNIKCYLQKQKYLANASAMDKKTLRKLVSKKIMSLKCKFDTYDTFWHSKNNQFYVIIRA